MLLIPFTGGVCAVQRYRRRAALKTVDRQHPARSEPPEERLLMDCVEMAGIFVVFVAIPTVQSPAQMLRSLSRFGGTGEELVALADAEFSVVRQQAGKRTGFRT